MRIGTWNLEGRWTPAHECILVGSACDVWLVTEAPSAIELPGHRGHLSTSLIKDSVHWAGILSRWPITTHAVPHPASVVASTAGVLFGCSVLPWPLSGPVAPWKGSRHPDRMDEAVRAVSAALVGSEAVWGGDWNQPLTGILTGFSRQARDIVLGAVARLELNVPTAILPGRLPWQASIDHIGVPAGWTVLNAGRVAVPEKVSDHHAYWVEAGV